MVEAILPTPRLNHQPEDEAAVAQVEMSEAHLADPSVPVFWILPKGLITTIFPPFSSPPEAFTAGHKALNYVASAVLMAMGDALSSSTKSVRSELPRPIIKRCTSQTKMHTKIKLS